MFYVSFYISTYIIYSFLSLRTIKNFVKEKKLKAAGSNFYEVDLCIDSRTLIALQKKKISHFN